jgi:exonuclease III
MIPPPITKITGSNNHYSLISLNINGLNSPVRHKLTVWICKQDPVFCCMQEMHLSDKDRHYLRIKGWKTIFQANGSKKQTGVAILISNNVDFQLKVIKKDKDGHFILIKGKIYQELSILIICSPNARAPTFIKETTKAQSRHCTSHNSSGRLQQPTLINGQIMETETKHRHSETNKSYETKGFNKYL